MVGHMDFYFPSFLLSQIPNIPTFEYIEKEILWGGEIKKHKSFVVSCIIFLLCYSSLLLVSPCSLKHGLNREEEYLLRTHWW